MHTVSLHLFWWLTRTHLVSPEVSFAPRTSRVDCLFGTLTLLGLRRMCFRTVRSWDRWTASRSPTVATSCPRHPPFSCVEFSPQSGTSRNTRPSLVPHSHRCPDSCGPLLLPTPSPLGLILKYRYLTPSLHLVGVPSRRCTSLSLLNSLLLKIPNPRLSWKLNLPPTTDKYKGVHLYVLLTPTHPSVFSHWHLCTPNKDTLGFPGRVMSWVLRRDPYLLTVSLLSTNPTLSLLWGLILVSLSKIRSINYTKKYKKKYVDFCWYFHKIFHLYFISEIFSKSHFDH